MGKLSISRYVNIKNNSAFLNGKELMCDEEGLNFGKFAKKLYKDQGMSYAKFFKMDKLAKLGFLSSEILLNNPELIGFEEEHTAIILANSSSSLNNDEKYQETIGDIPSPAVFVYTLPNIVIGEISIKNGIKGEAAFFVQEQFDILFMENYIAQLFSDGNTKNCIAGWLEYSKEENYNAFLMFIEQGHGESGIEFTSDNIKELFGS